MPDTTPAPAPVDPALTQRIARVLRSTPGNGWTYEPGQEKWDHHKGPDTPGHTYMISCALCQGDADTLAAAVLAELAPELTRAQYGDRTRQELASLAANAANALADEKRHYAIACAEIARLTDLLGQYADRGIANGERAERAETALTRAREAALLEGAAAIQAVIDRDKAKFPARSNDRAALGGARQIILGLLKPAATALTGPAEENQP